MRELDELLTTAIANLPLFISKFLTLVSASVPKPVDTMNMFVSFTACISTIYWSRSWLRPSVRYLPAYMYSFPSSRYLVCWRVRMASVLSYQWQGSAWSRRSEPKAWVKI